MTRNTRRPPTREEELAAALYVIMVAGLAIAAALIATQSHGCL